MAPTPTQPHRRGLVYSLSLFFMLAVLLSLGALWLMQSDRNLTTLQVPSDAQVLSARLAEMKWLCLQSIGIEVETGRDIGHRWINISDAFPLAAPIAPTTDLAYIRPLTKLINGSAGVQGNWSNRTNVSVNQFDILRLVAKGLALNTTSGTTYTQDNSAASKDTALLAGATNPQAILVSIVCHAPAGAASVIFSNPTAAGSGMNQTIHFADSTLGSPYSSGPTEFGPTNTKTFNASYFDSGAFWMQSIHADWTGGNPGSLKVWSHANASYPSISKANVSCQFNLTMVHADNGANPETVYLPLEVSVAYYGANYSGNLTLARE